jgi:putative transposase
MTNFSKLIKELLKPLPKNDYPALETFTFLSCWIGFALDKSIVSMRDLCSGIVLQGINVNLSTFSQASKIRETSPFEKVIVELNKRLVAKKGIENARALFPIDSTIISLTSKLLWSQGWHQVKLFSGLNSITTEVVGILIHFGQGHDSKEGGKTIEAIPVNGLGVMDRGFASNQRITELLESSDKHFVLRVKNNISLEMLENGQCKLGKDQREIEVRVVAFCDLESQTEFRLATDLPLEGEGALSNEEVAEIYIQRWQIELLWKFFKMPLKLDNLITKNENGIRLQLYSCIIAYLILQLIDIEEGFGKSLLDKLRYLQSFMCQHISYVHWFRRIVYST